MMCVGNQNNTSVKLKDVQDFIIFLDLHFVFTFN